jgi:drug/metabolite transporter (DMT)-like permease
VPNGSASAGSTRSPRPALPWTHGIAILYIGVVTYDLAYVVWNVSVARHGANTAAFFLYMIPAFGTLLAMAFLGEPVAPYHGAGMALMFSGVFLCLHVQRASGGVDPGRSPPPLPSDEPER